MISLPEKGSKKLINAWAFYDWANSVYNLVITATIFPIYFKLVTETKQENGEIDNTVEFLGFNLKNTTLYDFAISFAYLIVVLIAPFLSGIADYGGYKKRFMQFFCYLGAVSCSLLFFFDNSNLWLGVLLSILACIGYSGSLVFYNAFLPEIALPEQQDRVSAKGFALGYLGSALLLIASLIMVLSRPEEDGVGKMNMMRYSFLMVGIWWFLFAQIPFRILPDHNGQPAGAKKNNLSKGYQELRKVWSELKHTPRLKHFLLAFFVYSMGVQTIMLVANHFGSDVIKMESGQLITTILIIQFVAIGGAYLFSWGSGRFGNIRTLRSATLFWTGICLYTYFLVYTANQFYIVATFVGLVMGGIQSLSRSTYSKLLPETDDHASYFSFYDVCEKLSIVFGMGLFGLINEVSPSMREPIIVLISFFVLGYLLLWRVKSKEIS